MRREQETKFALGVELGHMFSQCPERKKTEDVTSGGEAGGDVEVCFKCGSTEHKSRHCKKTVSRNCIL